MTRFISITNTISTGLFFWSLYAGLIVLLGVVANWKLQKRSASFRHSVWFATSICIVAIPIVSAWVPGILPRFAAVTQSVALSSQRIELQAIDRNAPITTLAVLDRSDELDGELSIKSSEESISANQVFLTDSPRQVSAEMINGAIPFGSIVSGCWVLGMMVYWSRIYLSRRRLAIAFRQSESPRDGRLEKLVSKLARDEGVEIELTVSNVEVGPLVWGFMPAKLLLPASFDQLSQDSQVAALRHELAHVARGDEWVRPFLVALRAVFWFHPFVRYCCDQVQLFAEKACDDEVLRAGHQPSLYSELLLHVGSIHHNRTAGFNVSGMAQSQVADRIQSVLQLGISRATTSWSTRLAVLVAAIFLSLPIASLRLSTSEAGTPFQGAQAEVNPQSDSVPLPKVGAKDWPQWGGTSSRNNTPLKQKIPSNWNTKSGANVRWSMPLGSETYGGTVVANGKVYVGTNNGAAYIERYSSETDLGVLLCFNESDGRFLWQHSTPKLPTGRINDWPMQGICSTPLVDGDRLWYVTNRGEVVCLDTEGFRDGENDGPYQKEVHNEKEADVVWTFDMRAELGVEQKNMANCSVTCAGDKLFVCTSQGAETVKRIGPRKWPPSFICLSRDTGKLLWSSSSPGPNILHGQWSSPAYGVFEGVAQVIFGGGDGYLYGFSADGNGQEHQPLWMFDCNPKDSSYRLNNATRNPIVSTPMIHDGLIYVAVGEDPEHGEGIGHLWCVTPTKRGDVSPTLVFNQADPDKHVAHKRVQALNRDAGDFERPNPNSAEVWHYGGSNLNELQSTMHRSISTVAIQNGLLFVPDLSGVVHCLDARSGKAHWTHDLLAACWSSPLIVAGKVFVCDEDGDVTVFQLSDGKVVLAEHNLMSAIYSTPVVANDKLFITTRNRLWVIQEVGK
jgi:beta-lactamase regulating signal transducer with metallopeptidase domain